MTGNIKLDVSIPILGEGEKASLRAELGLPPEDMVFLGSSTWPGEEQAMIGALRAVRPPDSHAAFCLCRGMPSEG